MSKFKVEGFVRVWYRGTVEAPDRETLEGMDDDEMDLTEFDSSTIELTDINKIK